MQNPVLQHLGFAFDLPARGNDKKPHSEQKQHQRKAVVFPHLQLAGLIFQSISLPLRPVGADFGFGVTCWSSLYLIR